MRFIVQREKIPFDQNALSISEGENTVCLPPVQKRCPQTTLSKRARVGILQNHDFKNPKEELALCEDPLCLFFEGKFNINRKMTSRCKWKTLISQGVSENF